MGKGELDISLSVLFSLILRIHNPHHNYITVKQTKKGKKIYQKLTLSTIKSAFLFMV